MKALIERSLYQPAIVLPILMLVRLMTALDFSIPQIVLVLAFRGTRYVFNLIVHGATRTASHTVSVSHQVKPSQRVVASQLGLPSLRAPSSQQALPSRQTSSLGKTERTCHC